MITYGHILTDDELESKYGDNQAMKNEERQKQREARTLLPTSFVESQKQERQRELATLFTPNEPTNQFLNIEQEAENSDDSLEQSVALQDLENALKNKKLSESAKKKLKMTVKKILIIQKLKQLNENKMMGDEDKQNTLTPAEEYKLMRELGLIQTPPAPKKEKQIRASIKEEILPRKLIFEEKQNVALQDLENALKKKTLSEGAKKKLKMTVKKILILQKLKQIKLEKDQVLKKLFNRYRQMKTKVMLQKLVDHLIHKQHLKPHQVEQLIASQTDADANGKPSPLSDDSKEKKLQRMFDKIETSQETSEETSEETKEDKRLENLQEKLYELRSKDKFHDLRTRAVKVDEEGKTKNKRIRSKSLTLQEGEQISDKVRTEGEDALPNEILERIAGYSSINNTKKLNLLVQGLYYEMKDDVGGVFKELIDILKTKKARYTTETINNDKDLKKFLGSTMVSLKMNKKNNLFDKDGNPKWFTYIESIIKPLYEHSQNNK